MAQTNLTIRIDENIKQEAEILFNKMGLNMSSAINIFFRQALRTQSMPFELKPHEDFYSTDIKETEINDELFEEAAEYVLQQKKCSVSMLQLRFGIGFRRAQRLMQNIKNRGILECVDEVDAKRKTDLLSPPSLKTKGWKFNREEANER